MGKSYELKAPEVFDEITYRNGDYHYDDTELTNWVAKMDQQLRTRGKTYQMALPNNHQATVKNQDYGWKINQSDLVANVEDAFVRGTKTVNANESLTGTGFYNEQPITKNNGTAMMATRH